MFDLVVVGGGFSGLAAAFEFQRQAPGSRCLILDNHAMFGGEARQNEFEVDGHRLYGPQGSNGFLPPTGNSTLSDEVWREVAMPDSYEFASGSGDSQLPRCAWDSYDAMYWGERNTDVGYFFKDRGWVDNIWKDDLQRTPWDPTLQRDMLRAFTQRERFHGDEGLGAWLDSMSYHDYLNKVMKLDPRVAAQIDPVLAISDYGLSGDVVSAYGAYLLALPGMQGYRSADTVDFEQVKIMSFPGGNTVYARRIAQHLIPGSLGVDDSFTSCASGQLNFAALDRDDQPTRIRLNATAFDVRHGTDSVDVSYLRDGRVESLKARSVVMAAGGWVVRRSVADLPASIHASYERFIMRPCSS